MEPIIGRYVHDAKNTYAIMDVKYGNSHSQYPSEYLIRCVKGPNIDREMWVMRRTIILNNYLVTRECDDS